MEDTILACSSVSKTYFRKENKSLKNVVALDNVSFELRKGDRLGIVGLNGSGKSTLLKILSGQIKPTSGKVKMRYSPLSLSHFDSMLHPDLTGIENIELQFQQLKSFVSEETSLNQAINEIIDFSELGDFIYNPVKTYSSGMMLRLTFSMFKSIKPKILLLDEVFSAGDAIFQNKIDVVFCKFLESCDLVLVASHNLNEISKYCNKCLILEKGKLIFLGDSKSALDRYLFESVHKIPKSHGDYYLNLTLPISVNEFSLTSLVLTPVNNSKIDVSSDLEFKIIISKLIGENTIEPIIDIFCINGVHVLKECPVFKYKDFNYEMGVGYYEFSCIIQREFLNIGSYFINLSFCLNKRKIIAEFENIIFFNIEQSLNETNSRFLEVFNMKAQNKAICNPDFYWTAKGENGFLKI